MEPTTSCPRQMTRTCTCCCLKPVLFGPADSIARAAGAELDGSMVDIDLALGGSPLLRCSLVTRSVARDTCPGRNRLVKLGSGRSTGPLNMDNLTVSTVVRALVGLYSEQETPPRLRVSVTAAAGAGGRPAQLQLAVVADTGAPHSMLLRAEQASCTCCRCCMPASKWPVRSQGDFCGQRREEPCMSLKA